MVVQNTRRRRQVGWLPMLLLVLAVLAPQLALAQGASRLAEFLAAVQPADIVPGADRFGPPEGTPPVAPAFAGDRLLGYAFVNADWVNSTGYSGRPIDVLVGLGLDGKITGAKLMDHHEPIVLIGIQPERITKFIQGHVGANVLEIARAGPRSRPQVDIVSGATVTVMVIGDSIIRSGIAVARQRGLSGEGQSAAAAAVAHRVLADPGTATRSWDELVGDGSVRRLFLSIGDVSQAFERAGSPEAAAHPEAGTPQDAFIDLYVGLVSVPTIGRSLLGEVAYQQLAGKLQPGQQAILIAANGAYSFKGSGYVRGGIFDRIEVLQGDTSIHFRDRTHTRLGDVMAAGAPRFRDVDLFIVPAGTTLDPVAPWQLQLLAQRTTTGREKAFLTFDVGYELPEAYTKAAPPPAVAAAPEPAAVAQRPGTPAPGEALLPEETPLWVTIWQSKLVDIAILTVAILILTAIFFFQDWLVKRPVLYDRIRIGFLLFTLIWIGWVAQAQLSVVNVLAFFNSLRTDFRWEYFLMAPLIFILWAATAASLLFWNRGAFCGWLCPFGALQELVNRAARLLHVPQLKIPFGIHQRLTAIKYIVFLGLFGLSFGALAAAERAAEVEPFKTAIVLRFMREWQFVSYALLLLVASLFVERFFCRYLCPLGAALAIPARLRMFDWLRRYRECGNPCQRCSNECPVQAIHPEGHINPNECIQCLHCQMLYHHDHKCPVMIQRRLKREKRAIGASEKPVLPPRPATVARAASKGAT